jgi:peptidoglycan-associated lipoprotein
MSNPSRALAAVIVAVLCAACASGRKKAGPVKAAGDELQEASLRARSYEISPDIKIVYFALDSSRFSDAALATMKANVGAIKSKKNAVLLIEGHADDRGTIAYNLALGQERAQAVKEYYLSLGVPLNRMSTISYGELKPICKEEDEACWGQNRRADTMLGVMTP